jgi:hypothetical protein
MANRNSESRFAQVPRAEIRRARFKRDFSNITTINEGDLVPLYVDEVLPGDTISCDMNGLIRMSTPLYPVMDNCYLDTYAFFVPCRLLWEHWENLMGQNDSSYWAEKTEYSVPQTTAPSGGWKVGTIADYMGIPTGIENLSINSLPFRAYARIWNEWFRDENLQQPTYQSKGDATTPGTNLGNSIYNAQAGGLPLKVAKYHDYFTSCLPEPQKGEAAAIPIDLSGIKAPVTPQKGIWWGAEAPMRMTVVGRSPNPPTAGSYDFAALYVGTTAKGDVTNRQGEVYAGQNSETATNQALSQQLAPGNLAATFSDMAPISITINELRQAIALQHILEADARGGTRYVELLAHEFGVTSPDSRLQRSEYLGGTRVPININQVIQQSATTDASPQGNTAAYSMTTLRNKMCNYSAVEHGYLVILGAIRVDHSYQQGLSRMWTRKGRFDFYHPMLANLSEMAVLNKEIYAQGTAEDDEVFGYQEAWADYRYHPNIVTGEMRSTYAQTLDAWHYGDHYTKLPTLSSSWIQEGTENIDRTLAVQSENSHQFICDFFFDQTWTRPMPIYSIPGLNTI